MHESLDILFVTPEFAPFAKTGGLADASAALAATLAERGHRVTAVLPAYRPIPQAFARQLRRGPGMCVRMGAGAEEWCGVLEGEHEGVAMRFIEHDAFFNRPGLYHDAAMNDYADNPRRFGFLCRAALQLCMDRGLAPDVVHAHDWQAALVPAYLKTWFWNHPALGRAASVLTVHNVAYQGVYPKAHYDWLGLGAENYAPERFEAFGAVNFLKGGIHFADAVNTVSPGHASEITTPYGGFGLAPYLTAKGAAFHGILNGVDYSVWSPKTDPLIPARFSAEDLAGKAVCKRELQNDFLLEPRPDVPLFGVVGRLAEQKGYRLLRDALDRILDETPAQFAVLGSGAPDLAAFFTDAARRRPGRVGAFIGYHNALAHLVEAGADFFVMPSLYEPCGLNQMYSLRYGTPPVVRATGGLDDTVEQYDETTGMGTGFKFDAPTPQALGDVIGWAVSTFYDRPEHLDAMRRRGMRLEFSWDRSAEAYENLYAEAMQRKKAWDRAGAL